MADLMIRRFQNHQWLESWGQLAQAERNDYLAKVDAALQTVGGKRLVLIVCDSAYALENWNTFGLEVFPNQAAIEKHAKLLDQLGWPQHVTAETIIGTGHDLQDWLTVTLTE